MALFALSFFVRRVVAAILSSVSFAFMLMKNQNCKAQKLYIYMFRWMKGWNPKHRKILTALTDPSLALTVKDGCMETLTVKDNSFCYRKIMRRRWIKRLWGPTEYHQDFSKVLDLTFCLLIFILKFFKMSLREICFTGC